MTAELAAPRRVVASESATDIISLRARETSAGDATCCREGVGSGTGMHNRVQALATECKEGTSYAEGTSSGYEEQGGGRDYGLNDLLLMGSTIEGGVLEIIVVRNGF
jgi:hypothetical protein